VNEAADLASGEDLREARSAIHAGEEAIMTRLGALLLASSLAFAGPTGRADEPVTPAALDSAAQDAAAPAPAAADTATPAPPPAGTGTAIIMMNETPAPAPCCGGNPGLLGRLWDWLTYCPQSCNRACSHCTRQCMPTCAPPPYTYFLWHCQAGCGGHGCATSSYAAPAAGITPVSHSEPAAENPEPTTAQAPKP
jgi:hypothetical protein